MAASLKGLIKISSSPVRGLHAYVAKEPNKYNRCVGMELRGKKAASRAAAASNFTAAAKKCAK